MYYQTENGSAQLLFTAAGSFAGGIAFDPNNNSLWTGDYGDNTVSDYSPGGTLLASFTGATVSEGLAFDPADSTL